MFLSLLHIHTLPRVRLTLWKGEYHCFLNTCQPQYNTNKHTSWSTFPEGLQSPGRKHPRLSVSPTALAYIPTYVRPWPRYSAVRNKTCDVALEGIKNTVSCKVKSNDWLQHVFLLNTRGRNQSFQHVGFLLTSKQQYWCDVCTGLQFDRFPFSRSTAANILLEVYTLANSLN